MLSMVITYIRNRLAIESGQDLIEYAMLGGLIALALAAVAVLAGLTGAVTDMADGIGNCIDFNKGTTCAPF